MADKNTLTLKQKAIIAMAKAIPVGTKIGGRDVRSLVPFKAKNRVTRYIFGLSDRPAYERTRTIVKDSPARLRLDQKVAENLQSAAVRKVRKEIVSALESPEILFDYALAIEAKTIVELGTWMCTSTNALVRAASLTGGRVYSYDPNMFLGRVPPRYHPHWEFHQYTGEEGYRHWDKSKKVDLLLVDTDPHSHEQTLMWLREHWVKSLAPNALVLLDDAGQSFHGHPGASDVLTALREFFAQEGDRVDFLVLEDDAPPANGVAALALAAN
jgi:predicted O-methyltransferase YrrM